MTTSLSSALVPQPSSVAKARRPLRIVILGLTITSSWGNGHATTYRALARALAARGHKVTFLERDVPWYRDNRDLVILGSFVPEGAALGDWLAMAAGGVTAIYDIDTPVPMRRLEQGEID